MRIILVAILLLSSSFAQAAFRMPSAPRLHSILDARDAGDFFRDSAKRKAWWMPPPPPPRLIPNPQQAARRMRTGTDLLVAGGIFTGMAIGGFIYATSPAMYGEHDSMGVGGILLAFFSVIALSIGVTMMGIGGGLRARNKKYLANSE